MSRLRSNYAGERRTEHFGFQLTPSEKAELERRADQRGLLLAEFVRTCCLRAVSASTAIPRIRPPDAAALIRELERVANNLSQLAKHANLTRQLPEETLLLDAVTELKAALNRIV